MIQTLAKNKLTGLHYSQAADSFTASEDDASALSPEQYLAIAYRFDNVSKVEIHQDDIEDVMLAVNLESLGMQESLRNRLDAGVPLVVSYGMGVDSTAILVGLWREGIRPDAILFADTGSESQHTYDYLPVINAWLREVGFPEVTVVRYSPQRFKWNVYSTLEGNCISNRTLPSLAFGRKSCSLKWKGGPLDKEVARLYGSGDVYRAIGYDCSPADNKRFAHATEKTDAGTGQSRSGDRFIYPLHVWGWTREDCMANIEAAGLPVPPKSSCYFCPAMRKEEVSALPVDKLRKIVIMEANATPNLQKVVGLWRSKRMTDFIRSEGLLPEADIDALWNKWSAPDRIITENADVSEEILEANAALVA